MFWCCRAVGPLNFQYSFLYWIIIPQHHTDNQAWPYLIFVIFFPHTQFFVNFFSTQKRVNRGKIDFATKLQKSPKNQLYNKKHEFYIVEAGSTSHTCQMRRDFRFVFIYHAQKSEITPHVEKFPMSPHLSCIEIWYFSTWQIFSPQTCWWRWRQIWGMKKY